MIREKLISYRGDRTQAQMAKLYGVSQQAWCQWEQGLSSPNVCIMKRIEDDTHIPMEDIFFDKFNKKM